MSLRLWRKDSRRGSARVWATRTGVTAVIEVSEEKVGSTMK